MQHTVAMADFVLGPLPDLAPILAEPDGCLISSLTEFSGVTVLLAQCASRFPLVSNNSADTADTPSPRLAKLGIDWRSARKSLAGEATLRHAADKSPGARFAFFALKPQHELAASLPIPRESNCSDLSFEAGDTEFAFSGSFQLTALAHSRVTCWRTHPNRSQLARDGSPKAETGPVLGTAPDASACSLGRPVPKLVKASLCHAGAAAAMCVGGTYATYGQATRAAKVDPELPYRQYNKATEC